MDEIDAEEVEQLNGAINLKNFLYSRLQLIGDDYFVRNKNVNEYIKNEMQIESDEDIRHLAEICE